MTFKTMIKKCTAMTDPATTAPRVSNSPVTSDVAPPAPSGRLPLTVRANFPRYFESSLLIGSTNTKLAQSRGASPLRRQARRSSQVSPVRISLP